MSTTAADISYYAPEFIIEINSREIFAEISKTILSVNIDQELNKTNNFRFEVQDEFKGGCFQWLGHDLFKYGNNVSIQMGYVHNMHTMTEGKIQNISANFSKGTAPTFTVEGSDSAYKFLMEKSEAKVFIKKKDSEIAREIAQMEKAHLEAVVDETKIVFPSKTKQGGKSYFEFIKDMAKSNGFEFSLSGRKLYFVKPKKEKDAILTLKWGEELINFRPALNTAQAITEVVVRSWDRTGKKHIEVKVKSGEETKQEKGKQLASQIAREIYGDVVKVITDRPVSSVKEAREVAKSELKKASADFIKASAETIGIPELKPAVFINIEGLGDWFSGKYYIEKVTHRIDNNGYRTNFEASRNSI